MYNNTWWNEIADYLLTKPKDFFSQILSVLWKGHIKRLQDQTINKTATKPNQTEPNREKSVTWNWAMNLDLLGLSAVLPWVLRFRESLEIALVSTVKSTNLYHLSLLLPYTPMQYQFLDSWIWCCLSIALVVCLLASVRGSILQGRPWDNGSLASNMIAVWPWFCQLLIFGTELFL